MNREDLGKMLESHLAWPVVENGWSPEYRDLVKNLLQIAAEDFRNDVIEELISDVRTAKERWPWVESESVKLWLEDQKITED